MKCSQKVWYPNAVLAEEARRKLVQRAGHDHAQKRLIVYPCRYCGKFHVGHNRRSFGKIPVEKIKPAPTNEKLPSLGQLRRRLERIEKSWDRYNDYRNRILAQQILKRVEADLAWLEDERQREQINTFRARELRASAELAAKLYH